MKKKKNQFDTGKKKCVGTLFPFLGSCSPTLHRDILINP